MRIGIDVSQVAFENTGVANYLKNFSLGLVKNDTKNEYVFFFSSLRRKLPEDYSDALKQYGGKRVRFRTVKFPPSFLSTLWNKLHIVPIETFVGDVDIFISSDWTEPPTKNAKKATILYDLIVYKYPQETASSIVVTQKRKLDWVKKESDLIFCISRSTKNDAEELLGIDAKKLVVVYPGI